MTSSRLRSRDLQAIHRLVGECRELGDDPLVWRERLFAGLGKLVSADIVGGGEMAGCRRGAPRIVGTTDWGWEAGFDREGWDRSVEWIGSDPFAQRPLKAVLALLQSRHAVTQPRPRLVEDGAWYAGSEFQIIARPIGIDALMYSFHLVPGTRDDFDAISLNRELGRTDFGERERRLVACLHAELVPLIGGPLARFTEPSPSELAPRVREVLRCLLEGDGDKQIAARLRLSHYTVNQYTKTIFRHFGVKSRAELLARWIRRGWGARCGWLVSGDER